MAGASRHASPLRATEELVRANFSDEAYVNLAGATANESNRSSPSRSSSRPSLCLLGGNTES